MKEKGLTSGEVWRPTLGSWGSSHLLWELRTHATTGWVMSAREMIRRDATRKIVMSWMVLESIFRVTERERVEQHRVTIKELEEMMSARRVHLVWQHANTQPDFNEKGEGRKRFWACMNILMMEGCIEGEVRVYPAEMGWQDTVAELERLNYMDETGGPPRFQQAGDTLTPEEGAQGSNSEAEAENGGRDCDIGVESGSEAEEDEVMVMATPGTRHPSLHFLPLVA